MNQVRSTGKVLWGVAASLWAFAAGCHDHDHDHDHGHSHSHGASAHGHDAHDTSAEGHGAGHGHADDAVGITRYTDKVELFAEHPPAVVGSPMPFLAHLTVLQDFSALQYGTVTLRLVGPVAVSATVEKALRPGIFQPVVTPTVPGRYQGELVVQGAAVQDTITGFDVVVYESAAAAAAQGDAEAGPGAEPIVFLKEQQWQVPFGTAFAAQGVLTPTIEVPGEIGTPPAGQAEVTAVVTGRVMAPPEGLPRIGQVVSRGTLLATLAPAPDKPEAAARAELAVVEAEAQLEAAQAAVARSERLLAAQAIPARQLEQARRDLRVADKALQSAKRTQAMFSGAVEGGAGRGSYRITAPIAGVVTEVAVSVGHVIERGEHLLRIVDFDELWVTAHVPERDAAVVAAEQAAAFKVAGTDQWLPLTLKGAQASATLIHLGRVVQPLSRTVDVIYGLKEPAESLRVGALVQVAVPVGAPVTGVIVPRSAVLADKGRSLVYVQVEGEAFEERVVRLGSSSGANVLVTAGVTAGERLVTHGANVIRLSSRSANAPSHGHVH